MILFESDWDLLPNAIWDVETKNKSFLYYSGLLKSMGVKNHKWPLQLHDASLVGVNPRDPNLSSETIKKIIVEVKNNFFYFIREVMIIPGSDDVETVQYRFNRGMGALYWLYFTHCVPYLVMIRQTGKSFGMDTLDIWLANYRLYYAGLSLITKNETLRASNMRRIKEIEETLPWYLKVRLPKDPANTEEYHVSLMKNILKAHLASASPKMAEGLGRGLTDQHTRFDELAYLFNIEISLPAALAAGTAARERARRRNDPYGVIMATTAGKKDDRDGAYAYSEMMRAAGWTEGMMDCENEEALHKLVTTLAKARDNNGVDNLTVIASFIHTQLGYDDAWLRRQIRDAKAVGEEAERDFGNVWTSGTLQSPLGSEIAGVIRASEIREPNIQIFDNYGYALRWTNSQDMGFSSMKNQQTVIGLDASDAIGRDDIGLVIEDITNGGVVAAGDFNNLSIFDFSKWLADFLIDNPKATLVPEMRSSARAIVDFVISRLVQAGQDPFKRIYNNVVQNKLEKPTDFDAIRYYGRESSIIMKYKKEFGFTTAGSGEMSRSILYGRNLTSCANHCGRMAHDSRLINQILGLVIRNGRLDHASGGHDDLVVAWLLGHWFLTSAKNIDYYGIQSSSVLRYVDSGKEFKTPEERYKTFMNDRIRQELEKLSLQMRNESDDILYERLENKARMLIRSLRQEDMKTFSVSEFFEQIRLNRENAAR